MAGSEKEDDAPTAGFSPAGPPQPTQPGLDQATSEELVRAVLDQVPLALSVVSESGDLLWMNKRFADLAERDPRDLVGLPATSVVRDPEIAARVVALDHRAATSDQPFHQRLVVPGPQGERVWEVSWIPLAGTGGLPATLRVAWDATEHHATEQALRRRAFYDRLTGLPNRDLFLDRLGHAVRGTSRRGAEPFAVLFMDLDSFKDVNDTMGHSVGDALLVQVAARLRTCVRPGDTMARLGGDEFAVILPSAQNNAQALAVARRIHQVLTQPFQLQDKPQVVSTSIGVAMYDGSQSPDDVLRDADVAMYLAKREGTGRSRVFTERLRARAERTVQLKTELKQAIDGDELEVHYQPVVSLTTGMLVGLEALVRWRHPKRGLLLPAEFLPLARRARLMSRLQRRVLRIAARSMAEWVDSFGLAPGITLRINLSPEIVADPDEIHALGHELRAAGLNPDRLSLELGEAALDDEGVSANLEALREIGHGLVIDEFGSGPCSLKCLQLGPVSSIKLNRSCTANLGSTDAIPDPLIRATISAGNCLGLPVDALGVESTEQMQQLLTLGCSNAQGYLFSRPLTAEGVEGLLRRSATWDLPNHGSDAE